MKIITTTTLLAALLASPLAVLAQSPAAEITAEQKSAILAGDTSVVVSAIQNLGVDMGDAEAVSALAADIFNQAVADMTPSDYEGKAGLIAAAIVQAFTRVASNSISAAEAAQSVRETTKAVLKASIKVATAKGANPSLIAQSVARGAVTGAREGASDLIPLNRGAVINAAAEGSAAGAGEAAEESGLTTGIVLMAQFGAAQAYRAMGAGPRPQGMSPPAAEITPTDPSIQVISPENQS